MHGWGERVCCHYQQRLFTEWLDNGPWKEGPMTFSYWANTGFWWASFSRCQKSSSCNNLFYNRTLLGLSFMIMYTFLIITSNNFSVTVDFYLFKGKMLVPLGFWSVCVVHSMLYNLKNFFFGGQRRNKFSLGNKENGQKSWRHRWG